MNKNMTIKHNKTFIISMFTLHKQKAIFRCDIKNMS